MHFLSWQRAQQTVRAMVFRAGVSLLLIGLLTACGGGAPDRATVQQAVALQLEQTQSQIGELLDPQRVTPQIEVRSVQIKQRQGVVLEGVPSYRVRGNYDVTLKFPDRRVNERDNPFEVYVQQNDDRWQLARLQTGIDRWRTYPLGRIREPEN